MKGTLMMLDIIGFLVAVGIGFYIHKYGASKGWFS